MVWDRRTLIRRLGSLLAVALFSRSPRLAAAAPARDLGILTPFYRSTQLQGHLIGYGLIDIPDYLTASDIDLRYMKKPGMKQEVPFVDSFSIVRFLGGYREDWLKRSQHWDARLGLRSLDYAIRHSDGALQFRPELIRQRLQPFLEAGYRPQDVTIALDNVPWDLATKDGRPPEAGPWGRRSPPGNLAEWTATIRQFAVDLQHYLGPAAAAVRFKTGVEYDEKASFDGTDSEFYEYYQTTDRALHAVLPTAILTPGEFTGRGVCEADAPSCVYDTEDFLRFAAGKNLTIPYVPRSLNSFIDQPGVWPSATAERAIDSYVRLGSVGREIDQFGLFAKPFQSSDIAALQANWEFQTLVRLWARLQPRRIFHWPAVPAVGRLPLLDGSGFLRLVLDRHLGARAYWLDVQDQAAAGPGTAEMLAVGFQGGPSSAVVVSSFSTRPGATRRRAIVALPSTLPAGGPLKTIRYRGSDNVYMLMRRDLAAADNLKPEFAACPLCVAFPIAMARDADRARAMLARNWSLYVAAMKENLRWVRNDAGVARNGGQLLVTLEPNELVVIE
ncbi:MAG TPA: hypothetical protein VND95_17430 [Stellaceae bacterium]|nr:hypothetical protein [Stellaceae bacterium]